MEMYMEIMIVEEIQLTQRLTLEKARLSIIAILGQGPPCGPPCLSSRCHQPNALCYLLSPLPMSLFPTTPTPIPIPICSYPCP